MKHPSTTPTEGDNHTVAPNSHLLQSRAWGELKSQFGWTSQRLEIEGGIAQILYRHLPLGFTIAYIPKGPTVDWDNVNLCQTLFSTIHGEAKQQRAIFLKIEPNLWSADCNLHSTINNSNTNTARQTVRFLTQSGFAPADTIQPQTSIVIDIRGDEEAILAAMKQKTRYNIRLAKRKGITIRHGTKTDIPIFYDLARLTSTRDGFGVHSMAYYQTAHQLFAPDHCILLIAEFEGEPLAALLAFRHDQIAYYFYGASSNTHRNLMPAYLIQWEAIRWAKNQGCTHYDLWGIPNADIKTLEAEFSQRRDGLWGVYRFKRGFGGQVIKSVGAFDYIYNPLLYRLYRLRRGI